MPTDQLVAFLCFITDSQLVDMSAQVKCVRTGEVVGGHNWKKYFIAFFHVLGHLECFKAFFFLNGKWPVADTPFPPPLLEFSINFFWSLPLVKDKKKLGLTPASRRLKIPPFFKPFPTNIIDLKLVHPSHFSCLHLSFKFNSHYMIRNYWTDYHR